MVVSQFRNGRVDFRNLEVNGLNISVTQTVAGFRISTAGQVRPTAFSLVPIKVNECTLKGEDLD